MRYLIEIPEFVPSRPVETITHKITTYPSIWIRYSV